ncbi:hypothetical protein PRUPE_3G027600 [Prunus persica]|uniref:Uncharacterized protein n=1 Tax=Prunus persica TaxID=3760 RepID=A0A251PUA1_PRUPE|nr:hypothetical protein PRUPE_3G027600 [Prunus persica]
MVPLNPSSSLYSQRLSLSHFPIYSHAISLISPLFPCNSDLEERVTPEKYLPQTVLLFFHRTEAKPKSTISKNL